MDRQVKQRVVGAALLVAFGVIFIPIFLDNGAVESPLPPDLVIPPPPADDPTRDVPHLSQAAIDELESRAGEDVELPLSRAASDPAPIPAPAAAPPDDPPASSTLDALPETGTESPAATPTATPPASPALPANGERWAVQLGSFASEANARRLVAKLRAAALDAYSEQRVEQGATVFKVRVSATGGRAGAERLRQRLEREFEQRGMLVPYR
jgi:DedD protein